MEVAVAILNYNGKAHLEQYLPSVVKHSANATIYVIDNASTDDSVQFLKDNFPEVTIVKNHENGWFAKGYNDGLRFIDADYYILLNSDVEVTENWIQPCIDLLESDEKIVALQPKILAHKEKNKFEHAGAAGGFLDKNYYPFCRGRIFEVVEEDQGQYNDETEVFWATGACLFIESKAFHKAGGFDEDFFAHMEEIDLCWRLKRKGNKIFYCGKSTVYHLGGGTLKYMDPHKTYLNFRNCMFMIVKNHKGILLPKLYLRMLLDGAAGAMFLTKFQFRHMFAVIRAHMAMYFNLPKLLKKRKALKASATTSELKGHYQKNITFKKFLSGVKHFSELDAKDFR